MIALAFAVEHSVVVMATNAVGVILVVRSQTVLFVSPRSNPTSYRFFSAAVPQSTSALLVILPDASNPVDNLYSPFAIELLSLATVYT